MSTNKKRQQNQQDGNTNKHPRLQEDNDPIPQILMTSPVWIKSDKISDEDVDSFLNTALSIFEDEGFTMSDIEEGALLLLMKNDYDADLTLHKIRNTKNTITNIIKKKKAHDNNLNLDLTTDAPTFTSIHKYLNKYKKIAKNLHVIYKNPDSDKNARGVIKRILKNNVTVINEITGEEIVTEIQNVYPDFSFYENHYWDVMSPVHPFYNKKNKINIKKPLNTFWDDLIFWTNDEVYNESRSVSEASEASDESYESYDSDEYNDDSMCNNSSCNGTNCERCLALKAVRALKKNTKDTTNESAY